MFVMVRVLVLTQQVMQGVFVGPLMVLAMLLKPVTVFLLYVRLTLLLRHNLILFAGDRAEFVIFQRLVTALLLLVPQTP